MQVCGSVVWSGLVQLVARDAACACKVAIESLAETRFNLWPGCHMAACLSRAELPETSAAAQQRGKKRVPGNAGARLRNELKRKSLAVGELVDCLQGCLEAA